MKVAEIRSELRTYKSNQAKIQMLKLDLDGLSMLPDVDTSQPAGGKTYKFHSSTEDAAIKKNKIENKIRAIQTQMTKLDIALDSLQETQRDILILKYIDGYSWRHVSNKRRMPIRTCRNISFKALQEMRKVL